MSRIKVLGWMLKGKLVNTFRSFCLRTVPKTL